MNLNKIYKELKLIEEFESNFLITKESEILGPALLCTGSKVPDWLEKSRLPVDSSGRVLTTTVSL